jgi:PAS domain S-box-containing protein
LGRPPGHLHGFFTGPGGFHTPPIRTPAETRGMRTAVCSLEGIIRGADAPFAELHGFRAEELQGSPLTALIAPHCRNELSLHILVACSRGTHDFPSVHRKSGGEEFPVEVSLRLEDNSLRYEVRDPG